MRRVLPPLLTLTVIACWRAVALSVWQSAPDGGANSLVWLPEWGYPLAFACYAWLAVGGENTRRRGLLALALWGGLFFPLCSAATNTESWLLALKVHYLGLTIGGLLWGVLTASRTDYQRVILALATFALCTSIWTAAWLSTDGDEPVYLLHADSILADGDVVLGNNVAAGSYLKYHTNYRFDPASFPLYANLRPGFALVLLPGMALGGRIGVAVQMALFAALLYWQILRWLLDLGFAPRARIRAVTALATLSPLAFYSSHIFPELPAALCAVVAMRVLTTPQAARWYWFPVALTLLPLLRKRYLPLAAMMLAAYLMQRLSARSRLLAVSLTLAGAAVYSWADLLLFDGNLLLNQFLRRDTLEALTSLRPEVLLGFLGMFLDQEYGLFLVWPWTLLFLLAAVAPASSLSGVRPWRGMVFGVVGGALLALLLMRNHFWYGGWNPPARFLAVYVPCLAPLAAQVWSLPRLAWLRSALVMLSAANTLPMLLVPEWRFPFGIGQSQPLLWLHEVLGLALHEALPSAMRISPQGVLTLGWWVVGLGTLTVAFWLWGEEGASPSGDRREKSGARSQDGGEPIVQAKWTRWRTFPLPPALVRAGDRGGRKKTSNPQMSSRLPDILTSDSSFLTPVRASSRPRRWAGALLAAAVGGVWLLSASPVRSIQPEDEPAVAWHPARRNPDHLGVRLSQPVTQPVTERSLNYFAEREHTVLPQDFAVYMEKEFAQLVSNLSSGPEPLGLHLRPGESWSFRIPEPLRQERVVLWLRGGVESCTGAEVQVAGVGEVRLQVRSNVAQGYALPPAVWQREGGEVTVRLTLPAQSTTGLTIERVDLWRSTRETGLAGRYYQAFAADEQPQGLEQGPMDLGSLAAGAWHVVPNWRFAGRFYAQVPPTVLLYHESPVSAALRLPAGRYRLRFQAAATQPKSEPPRLSWRSDKPLWEKPISHTDWREYEFGWTQEQPADCLSTMLLGHRIAWENREVRFISLRDLQILREAD